MKWAFKSFIFISRFSVKLVLKASLPDFSGKVIKLYLASTKIRFNNIKQNHDGLTWNECDQSIRYEQNSPCDSDIFNYVSDFNRPILLI